MKIYKLIFAIALLSGGLFSCEKEDSWKDFQSFGPNKDLVGEYMVTYYDKTELENPLDDPTVLMIYNTSSSEDSIWIDDNKHFWQYKVKAKVSGSTISVDKGVELYWDDSTSVHGSISNGNLYLELEWVSDAGTIYVAKGKRKTGF